MTETGPPPAIHRGNRGLERVQNLIFLWKAVVLLLFMAHTSRSLMKKNSLAAVSGAGEGQNSPDAPWRSTRTLGGYFHISLIVKPKPDLLVDQNVGGIRREEHQIRIDSSPVIVFRLNYERFQKFPLLVEAFFFNRAIELQARPGKTATASLPG